MRRKAPRQESLFIDVARTLWAFNTERVRDESGNELLPDTESLMDIGLVMQVAPRGHAQRRVAERLTSSLYDQPSSSI